MIRSTQIIRLDGLILCGSVDDDQSESALVDIKAKVRKLIRVFNKNSASEASIESDQFTIHYLVRDSVVFLCICDQSYPRKLAFTYLSDISGEFTTIYPSEQYLGSTTRSYGFVEFDTYIQKTKRTYQDSRATQNLDKLNDELKDVTKVMTKNIEDLLYRGDSLDKMGEMSGRLREDSRKYKKAAVKINWDAMLAKVSIVFLLTAIFFLIAIGAFMHSTGFKPTSFQLMLYALIATVGVFLPVIFVMVMYILLIGWLMWLYCWLRGVQVVVAMPSKLLHLHRDVQPGSRSYQLVMDSLQWSSTVDDVACSVWQWLDDFVTYGEGALENLSLRFDSTAQSEVSS